MKQLHQISIIYPDTPELRSLADTLAAQMEHFHIPGEVRSRTGICHLEDVKDPWLIVLCTPDTPKDPEILRNIREFTEQGLYQHILTLLVSGDPAESFPEPLLHEHLPDGTIVDHEPLAANIVSPSAKESVKKLKVERLRLLAPVLGVPFDELMNRRRRQRNRILAVIAAAVLVGACAFLAVTIHRASVFSSQQKDLSAQYDLAEEARDQAAREEAASREAFAAAIGVEASEVLKTGDTELAMLLCLEYLPEYKDLPELTDTLTQALTQRCGAGYVPVTILDPPEEEEEPAEKVHTFDEFMELSGLGDEIFYYYENGDYTITFLDGTAYFYRTDPLELLFTFQNPHTQEVEDYSFDILTLDSGKAYLIHGNYVYDIGTGRLVTMMQPRSGVIRIRGAVSSEGYVVCRRGLSQLYVIDLLNGNVIADLNPPFYKELDVTFAGPASPVTGLCDSTAIQVEGLLYRYQDEAIGVPVSLEDQIALAEQLLDGRTLTEEERARYSLS